MNCRTWIVLLAATLGAAGCSNQDTDRLQRIGQKSVAHIENASGGAQSRFFSGTHAVRGTLSRRALDSRVATRLRWDKPLEGCAIDVTSPGPGVVALHGTVFNDGQRQRAAELALATSGVEDVLNELHVQPPAGDEK